MHHFNVLLSIFLPRIGLLLAFIVTAAFVTDVSATPANERIVVTATRQAQPIQSSPGAIDIVDAEKLRATQSGIDLSELLQRVPGLQIQNRHNYAQDTQISSRGFGARATFGIRGIKIYVDDIPITLPDGQAQGALIPLAAVQSIEVLRGPWSVAYGNAAGGVIAATTVSKNASNTAPMLAFHMQRGADGQQVDSLLARGAIGLVSHQRFQTDGFRPQSKALREHTYVRFEPFNATDNTRWTVTANLINQPDSQDPLGLTQQQVDQNPRQAGINALAFDTRKSIRHQQLGSVISHDWGAIETKLISYLGQRQIVQFLAVPTVAQLVATSAGGVIDLSRDFYGFGLRVGQMANASGLAWTIGIDADFANDKRLGFENFARVTNTTNQLGQRGLLRRDEMNRQRSIDFFGQMSMPIDAMWTAHAAVRQSRLNFRVQDNYIRLGNPDDSGTRSFGALSPGVRYSEKLERNKYPLRFPSQHRARF